MGQRQKRFLVLGVVSLLVAAGGVFAWQRTRPAPVAVPPDVPAAVRDADVRAALTRARDQVLAEPRSGQAWGDLGLTYRAHNLNPESNACFATAAKLDPRNPRWPYLIGIINLLIAPDDAVPHLQTAYDLAVETEHQSLTRLRLAEALLDRGDLDGASKLFAEEVRINPLNPRAQFGLGVVAVSRGDHRAAANILLLAADSPFTRRKAATLLAASHLQLGNAADAARFERDAAAFPDDLSPSDSFLSEYLRKESGHTARMKAVEEFEASGRLAESVAALEEIAETTPDDQVLASLGINLAKMGDFARAERALRVVTGRTPDHAVARYFLGIAVYMQAERLWQAGDQTRAKPRFEEAVKELRKAAELKPDKGLAHLYAGLALKYLENLPEAADQCRAAVRASPQFADAHLGLAEVLIAMDKPTEAVPHLETAARLAAPNDTRAKALLEKIGGMKP